MAEQKQIWSLDELPELRAGDCLAFKAEGYQIPVMKLIGAKSFHWAMCGRRVSDDELSTGDYSVHDSIDKGITAHLLSEYQTRHMRIYRPRMAAWQQKALEDKVMKRYLFYGDQKYDWKGVIMVGIWVILNKLLRINVEWWEHNSDKFWCLEFDELVWRKLWRPLVPITEPPYPTNMEQSNKLELIWGTF